MKRFIEIIRNIQIVYTLVENPMMKGATEVVVLEQSTDLKSILSEHRSHPRDSLIKVSFRIRRK